MIEVLYFKFGGSYDDPLVQGMLEKTRNGTLHQRQSQTEKGPSEIEKTHPQWVTDFGQTQHQPNDHRRQIWLSKKKSSRPATVRQQVETDKETSWAVSKVDPQRKVMTPEGRLKSSHPVEESLEI